MKSINVPVSQNNLNFLKKIHPTKIRLSSKDDLGLQFLGLLKLHSLHFKQRNEKFIKEQYPVYLEILVSEKSYTTIKNISLRGIHALNIKIDLMIKRKAYEFIRQELNKARENENGEKLKIADALNLFFETYSLILNPKQESTLIRYERRLREKNGELLYKQNRKNQDGNSKTEH